MPRLSSTETGFRAGYETQPATLKKILRAEEELPFLNEEQPDSVDTLRTRILQRLEQWQMVLRALSSDTLILLSKQEIAGDLHGCSSPKTHVCVCT